MLAYIKGTLEAKMKGFVVIDVGGLGYKIYMSDIGMEKLGKLGETVKVHTYYQVREDDISIFGFNTSDELIMFELMISVSGIGAKTALAMLAVIEPSKFALAVITEDVDTLTQIPGIGPKSAKRIILELKDKVKKDEQIAQAQNIEIQKAVINDNKVSEAASALLVLGYNKKDIDKALSSLDKKDMTVEEIIKKGLSILSL